MPHGLHLVSYRQSWSWESREGGGQEGLLEEGTAREQSLEVEEGEGRPRELMRSDG